MTITQKLDELPEDIREFVISRHSHADIVCDQDPNQIIYREFQVLEIINYILNKYKDDGRTDL